MACTRFFSPYKHESYNSNNRIHYIIIICTYIYIYIKFLLSVVFYSIFFFSFFVSVFFFHSLRSRRQHGRSDGGNHIALIKIYLYRYAPSSAASASSRPGTASPLQRVYARALSLTLA